MKDRKKNSEKKTVTKGKGVVGKINDNKSSKKVSSKK